MMTIIVIANVPRASRRVVVAARARTSLVPDVVLLTVVLVLDGIDIVTAIVVFDAAPIAIAIAIASPSRAAARGGRRGEVRWRGGLHGSGLKNMCGLVPRGGVAGRDRGCA